MLKPLRHPTVFVLLTACLAGWLGGWVRGDEAGRFFTFWSSGTNYVFMPVYDALDLIGDLPERGPSQPLPHLWDPQFHSNVDNGVIVIRTPDGKHEALGSWSSLLDQPLPLRDTAGTVFRHHHEFRAYGLLTPCVLQDAGVYDIERIASGGPQIDKQAAIDTAVVSGTLPQLHTWSVNWANVAHDTALALTLLAWLYALLTIPTWKLWRHLTPAQRRRQRHTCPNCGYDRSAAPEAPCPECGTALPLP